MAAPYGQQPQFQLPPGWIQQQDAQGRPFYVDQRTGTSQYQPPGAPQPGAPQPGGVAPGHQRQQSAAGFPGQGARGPVPPAGYPQPGQAPPPVASPPVATAPRSKRAYAANQTDAYSGDTSSFAAPSAPGQAPVQPQFYSPALGDQQQQQQPVQGGQYFQPGQQAAGQPAYGQQQQPQQPYPGQQQQPGYGQQMNGMTQQFGQMGLGQKPISVSTINLINLPLNPADIHQPPPEIKLPPQTCISQNPLANADPSYQRSTINAIPTTATMLNKSKLPFALVCTPYRSVKPGDPEVPVISDTVIARCRRCRTYINPYVTFVEAGNRWKCCMCNLSNEVPQLFDWDQQANAPANRWERAELNHGVVDFVAPTEYMVRAPQPPVYVFLIDVSYAAVHSGMVATAARTILESLDRLPDDDNRAKICIIGIDTVLHFFTLAPGSTEPTMLVIGDLDDIFLPKPNDLLINLSECRAGVDALLGRLSDMFKDNNNVGSALGAALQVAYKLISPIGGKVMVLSATLPSVGPGALKNREDIKLLGTPKESSLLQAATSFYKTLAIDCSRSQVSVDMWLFASSYTDVATLSGLPRYTGGQTFFYPAFDASRTEDALKFAHEFGEVLASPILLEAVMRVRATKGLRMSAFHGNFFVRSTDLLALPAVPVDQSYTIEMQIEDPLTSPVVVFQTAVLHTTSYGERRIRVVTTAVPTTNSMSELFASVDQIALATLLANKAVERSLQAKIEDARDAVLNKLVDVLSVYKQTMTSAGSGASPQLVTAENMKHLPLLLLGLLKHVGLRQSSQIPSDLRAYAQALLTTLPSQLLIPYLHPTFFSLHNMPRDAGTVGDNGVVLPPALPLTSERLERHGLFMIEDGQNIFLWVGSAAVPQLIKDVFDLPNYQSLHGGKTTLPVLDNPFSQRVNAVIGKVREMRRGPYYPHLYVCKEDGEPSLRMWALSCLVEDAQQPLHSYHQFLNIVRDKVNGTTS